MYIEHYTCKLPDDLDGWIWRYMDFTKFVALLNTASLYFCRADKLGDRFEGSYPIKNVERRRSQFSEREDGVTMISRDYVSKVGLNCWHMNPHESAAMWSLYAKSGEGIAVRSTCRRLIECLNQSDTQVMNSKVSYIDYSEDAFDEGNSLTPFLHKRQSFQHEQELRAIVSGWPDYDKTGALRLQDFDEGKKVPVDLHTLADSIFISPLTSSWFRLLVEGLVHQYQYTFAVKQSDLDRDPVY